MSKAKIAVLGGGAGSLAAAFALTSRPGWNNRFEITVYQMGWRLGGKGASSRGSRRRNEEHGLHVLGGFYHNAMRMLRECYIDWQGLGLPHAVAFGDAFLPHNRVHLKQRTSTGWEDIELPFRPNQKELGGEPTELTPWEIVRALIEWIADSLSVESEDFFGPQTQPQTVLGVFAAGQLSASGRAFKFLLNAIGRAWPNDQQTRQLTQALDSLVNLLSIRSALMPAAASPPLLAVMLEIGIVVVRGILTDKLHQLGFDRANNEELLAWLRRHGATNTVTDSAIVRATYDYAFAYEDGDPTKPSFSAGIALRGLLRLLFTYHRAVFVHMNGGMGETVFTPLYEVLKARGVKFRFFHRIDRLQLDATSSSIDEIHGTRQATPTAGLDAYEPLIDCAGRQAWPIAPLYDQLEPCEQPVAWAEDLYESPWTEPAAAQPFVLKRGQDFDLAVLGISVGALKPICAELAAAFPRWQQMLQSQQAIQTISTQIWMSHKTADLGWTGGQTVLTCFAQLLPTWADMSFLLPLEQNQQNPPQHLSYLCGTMTRSWSGVGSPPANYKETERQRAREATHRWLRDHAKVLWPNAVDAGVGLKPTYEVERYVRANSFPSEGYVLSRPGTIDDRLRTDEAFVSNLYLTGDWIRTGMDCGAFEVAVMAGLQCSRAISGYPIHIPGETDFP